LYPDSQNMGMSYFACCGLNLLTMVLSIRKLVHAPKGNIACSLIGNMAY
jgi:hypothetical protein